MTYSFRQTLYLKLLEHALVPDKRIKYFKDFLRDLDYQKAIDLVLLTAAVIESPPVNWALGEYTREEISKAWDIIVESLDVSSLEQEALLVLRKLASIEDLHERARVFNAKLDLIISHDNGEEFVNKGFVH